MGEAKRRQESEDAIRSAEVAAEVAERRGRKLNSDIHSLEAQLRQLRKQQKSARPAKVQHRPAKPDPNAEAKGFMAWQHDQGITCIACLREGEPGPDKLKGEPNPIEVAHQRRNSTAAGWQSNRLGKRVSDLQTVPLCRWHHQLAPNACDKGQAKFWDRLGVDVVAYCAELFRAFNGGFPGAPVARMFALSAQGAETKQPDKSARRRREEDQP